MMPPDTGQCIFLGRAVLLIPAERLWQEMLSGKIRVRVYPVGEADFGPVPISPLALQAFDKSAALKSFQVEVRDEDPRRDARRRRRIPVPHWLYVVKADLPQQKQRTGPGAPEKYDWDDIGQFVRKEFETRGDFRLSDNQVKGWRSQNDLFERIKDYLQRRDQPIPAASSLKEKVGSILKQIRSELPTDH